MSNDLFSEFDSPPVLNLGGSSSGDDPWQDLDDDTPRIPGYTRLSWLVVIVLAVLLAGLAVLSNWAQTRGEVSRAEMAGLKSEGQTVLALKSEGWFSRFMEEYGGGAGLAIRNTVDRTNDGPLEQRMGHAILVCETAGPAAALQSLQATREKAQAAGVDYTPRQRELESVLTRVFEEYEAGNWAWRPPETERQQLESVFGWLAELLFNPEPDPAPPVASRRQEMMTDARASIDFLVAVAGIVFFGLILGIILLFVFAWMLSSGRIRGRVGDGTGGGEVYIEAFAICLLLFVGMSILAGMPGPLFSLFRFGPLLLPVVAVGWCVARGLTWRTVCHDTGLAPANPLKEIACGILGYVALFPLVFAGMLLTMLLSAVMHMLSAPHEFSPMGVPHPVAHDAVNGDPTWAMIRLLLAAAVAAPLVEEFMFRGLLYRHLRDASRHMTRWISILFSSLVNSLLFAAIHPQGLAAIPALVILAFGFCLVRQWRGSLLAPVTMHAIHNAFLITILFRML